MRTRCVLYPGAGEIYSCELERCRGCEGELQTAYTSKYKTVQTMQEVLRVGQRTKRCKNPACRVCAEIWGMVKWRQLAPLPWAKRVWALPFLTVLAPSERYYKGKVRKHKKLTQWAHQVILQVRRWLPKRFLVVVADSSFAVIELLWQLRQLQNPVCMITRFRLDAALYEPVKVKPGARGRPRKKGQRLPTLETVAQDKHTRWKRLTVQVSVRDLQQPQTSRAGFLNRSTGLNTIPIRSHCSP